MPLIDTTTEFGQRVQHRLAEEPIVWLTTVSPSGAPQPSPVWFLPDGDDEIVIYSQPNTPKVRNIEANPKVAVSFNATSSGGDVAIFTGEALIDHEAPSVSDNEAYIAKYRNAGKETLGGTGLTPEEFSAEYSVPIRVSLAKLRGF
jgi:PPOX class probable F420-dependent enzyme